MPHQKKYTPAEVINLVGYSPLFEPGGHPFKAEFPKRMTWTVSSLKLFRKCPRKWFWKYIMRVKPKCRAVPLLIGSMVHSALEEWYKSPYRSHSMHRIATKWFVKFRSEVEANEALYDQEDLDRAQTALHTFIGMMRGYAAIYADERKRWNIDKRMVEVPFRVDMGDFDFAGKIDAITARGNGQQAMVVEHKTVSSIRSSYIDRLPLDSQVRGYVFGAMAGLDVRVKKVCYDVIRKCRIRRKGDEPQDEFNHRIETDYMSRPEFYFFREELRISNNDIAAFQAELHQTHDLCMRMIDNLRECGKLCTPREWLPNDAVCDEYFRECSFLQLCTTGLDRGTAMMYDRAESVNEELNDTVDTD